MRRQRLLLLCFVFALCAPAASQRSFDVGALRTGDNVWVANCTDLAGGAVLFNISAGTTAVIDNCSVSLEAPVGDTALHIDGLGRNAALVVRSSVLLVDCVSSVPSCTAFRVGGSLGDNSSILIEHTRIDVNGSSDCTALGVNSSVIEQGAILSMASSTAAASSTNGSAAAVALVGLPVAPLAVDGNLTLQLDSGTLQANGTMSASGLLIAHATCDRLNLLVRNSTVGVSSDEHSVAIRLDSTLRLVGDSTIVVSGTTLHGLSIGEADAVSFAATVSDGVVLIIEHCIMFGSTSALFIASPLRQSTVLVDASTLSSGDNPSNRSGALVFSSAGVLPLSWEAMTLTIKASVLSSIFSSSSLVFYNGNFSGASSQRFVNVTFFAANTSVHGFGVSPGTVFDSDTLICLEDTVWSNGSRVVTALFPNVVGRCGPPTTTITWSSTGTLELTANPGTATPTKTRTLSRRTHSPSGTPRQTPTPSRALTPSLTATTSRVPTPSRSPTLSNSHPKSASPSATSTRTLVVPFFTTDAPGFAPALQASTTAATVFAILAVTIGSPSASLNIARSNGILQALSLCANETSAGDSLPWVLSPLRLELGDDDARFYRGAAVGVAAVGAFLLMLAFATVLCVAFGCPSVSSMLTPLLVDPHHSPMSEAVMGLRLPAVVTLIGIALAEPAVSSLVSLFRTRDSRSPPLGYDVALAVGLGLPVCAALACVVGSLVAAPKCARFAERGHTEDRTGMAWPVWIAFGSRGVWLPKDDPSSAASFYRLGGLYVCFRGWFRWVFLADVLSMIAIAALRSVAPWDIECRITLATTASLLVLLGLAVLLSRCNSVPALNVLNVAALLFAAAACGTFAARNSIDIPNTLAIVSQGIGWGEAVLSVVLSVHQLFRDLFPAPSVFDDAVTRDVDQELRDDSKPLLPPKPAEPTKPNDKASLDEPSKLPLQLWGSPARGTAPTLTLLDDDDL